MRINLNVHNETALLKKVILGIADRNGGTPKADEAYDPKSLENIRKGTYPKERDMVRELELFKDVLEKHEVKVYRPEVLADVNQIFTRDIGFVINDFLFKGNILPDRDREWRAIQHFAQHVEPSKLIIPPKEVHIEGGDVIVWNDHIFVGSYYGGNYRNINTARTNPEGVEFLKDFFPDKQVVGFDLIKSTSDPKNNALHLDCCFQPIGYHQAIICKDGFANREEVQYLEELFGAKNLFEISREEMYCMFSNIFSISPTVIVSEERFDRLNQWLISQGYTIETIPYHEIGKQGGLLRCSTLPLLRN